MCLHSRPCRGLQPSHACAEPQLPHLFPITFPYAHHALDRPASLLAILEIIPCLWGDSPGLVFLSPRLTALWISILFAANHGVLAFDLLHVVWMNLGSITVDSSRNRQEGEFAKMMKLHGVQVRTILVWAWLLPLCLWNGQASRLFFGLSGLSFFTRVLKVGTDTLVRLCGQRWGNVCRCGGPPFSYFIAPGSLLWFSLMRL